MGAASFSRSRGFYWVRGCGGGRGDVGGGDLALLPKRHARFLERFNAAKEARVAGEGGVTSFGALLVDTVGRAD